jgi:hypothetical protein
VSKNSLTRAAIGKMVLTRAAIGKIVLGCWLPVKTTYCHSPPLFLDVVAPVHEDEMEWCFGLMERLNGPKFVDIEIIQNSKHGKAKAPPYSSWYLLNLQDSFNNAGRTKAHGIIGGVTNPLIFERKLAH